MNNFLQINKVMLAVLLAHVPVLFILAGIGEQVSSFVYIATILLGGICLAGFAALKESEQYGYLVAVAMMAFSAILIQSQLGQIEMHFHIFASMAILIIYRNWLVVVTAAATIAVHHLLLTYAQLNQASLGDMPIMVYSANCSWGLFLVHATFVIFEAAALSWMAHQMQVQHQVAANIVTAVDSVAKQQDLSIRAAGKTPTEKAFNDLLGSMENFFQSMRGSSQQLNSIAADVVSVANQAKDGYQEQAQQADQIASATQELSYSIEDVAKNLSQNASDTEEVRQQSESGLSVITQSVKSAERLQDEINGASEQIKKLENRCEEVGALVDVIRSISEQTNLLALNAAIEAARAGEMGRGFAVVADEVRSLAQRANESTDQIQAQMDGLISEAANAVKAMQTSSDLVSSNATGIQSAGSTFDLIVSKIQDISDKNSSIVNNTDQQSQVVGEINQNITQLASLINNIESSTQDMYQQSEVLSDIVQQTQTQVGQYQTS